MKKIIIKLRQGGNKKVSKGIEQTGKKKLKFKEKTLNTFCKTFFYDFPSDCWASL